jgi:phytoene dehydrogenase-like protein
MKPILIVGAGLAGLNCAKTLYQNGQPVLVLEASDHLGGRVWSDEVDGFVLDHGFQVLLDSYPETQAALDYKALRLCPFLPGALIRSQRGFRRIVDPLRDPMHVFDTLRSGAFTPGDMWRVLQLRREMAKGADSDLPSLHGQYTSTFLKERGFSDRSIEHFFKPFFSGVFLEEQLSTPADMFAFVFRMFASGSACLPEQGMRAIPLQLASRLPEESLRLNTAVAEVASDHVRLADGTRIDAQATILATDYQTTARLLGMKSAEGSWRSTTSLYYSAAGAPITEPILMLNGTGTGMVNNVVVPSNVSPCYAPQDRALVAVSLLGECTADNADLDTAVRAELQAWFGSSVANWEFLRSYRIPRALPTNFGASVEREYQDISRARGILVAGDFLVNPSINGAMASGRTAAERLLQTQVKVA